MGVPSLTLAAFHLDCLCNTAPPPHVCGLCHVCAPTRAAGLSVHRATSSCVWAVSHACAPTRATPRVVFTFWHVDIKNNPGGGYCNVNGVEYGGASARKAQLRRRGEDYMHRHVDAGRAGRRGGGGVRGCDDDDLFVCDALRLGMGLGVLWAAWVGLSACASPSGVPAKG